MNATARPRVAAIPARTAAPLPRFCGSETTWSAPAPTAAVGRAVPRPVVDDDDLEAAVAGDVDELGADGVDGQSDAERLAEGGDDHAQAELALGRRLATTVL